MNEPIVIDSLDHLVLTVRDIGVTSDFYSKALGMREISFGANRKGLLFGSQKINLHQVGDTSLLRAAQPLPGSADLCFITPTPLAEIKQHLKKHSVEIIAGPCHRTGARGEIISIYIRDPDGNLIELANDVSQTKSPTDHTK